MYFLRTKKCVCLSFCLSLCCLVHFFFLFRLLTRSLFCRPSLRPVTQQKENLLRGRMAFPCLCCSHSVNRLLPLCGFGKKDVEGVERRNKLIFK